MPRLNRMGFYDSPQSIVQGNYTTTQYLARSQSTYSSYNFNQMPPDGLTVVGSDYFMDFKGYLAGFKPQLAASEPPAYGPGIYDPISGTFKAQPNYNP